MNSILVALLSLAAAFTIQRLVLRGRAKRLAASEQAYRFHGIRDALQELALRGIVDQRDSIYQFVMWTANLAIKNAGVMRVRDTLSTARTIGSQMKNDNMARFLRDVRKRPEPLQRLVGETFTALAEMLVANDHLVRAGLNTAVFAAKAWKQIQPVLNWFISAMDWLAGLLAPNRAQAVTYARKYHRLGGHLAAA